MKRNPNSKIKNAKETFAYGINFKSRLEVTIYRTLVENGITPEYELKTFEFVPRIRPTMPFFNRIGKAFGLDMRPIRPITYTPDFTFEYNGILVVIEVKGFENDVFYIKKNLFRRYIENLGRYSIYFEIRNKKELLEALRIIKMETPQMQQIRKLISSLPEKDIPIGSKLLEKRDWEELSNLVSSAIRRVEKANIKGDNRYSDVNLVSLYRLQVAIPDPL